MVASATSAFAQLHAALKEALYRMKWTELHGIQVEAIHEVLAGERDLIISARTAAGKTEAAFLPILSRLVSEPASGVGALYVGPLKALINDQFQRLEMLCLEAEIPVHKWHGDVTASRKHRLLDQPSGVLLITPESIESLFVNHPQKLARLFSSLRFIVVDEIHSFIGTERGAHLRSLLYRVMPKSVRGVRLVGLSATLGDDLEAAKRWLRPRSPETVHLIFGSDKKTIQLKINGYLRAGVSSAGGLPSEDDSDDLPPTELEKDVFDAFQGRTALVFANQKSHIEQIADFAKRRAAREGVPDCFRVHHGSLSKVEREDTEESLKSSTPTATFCSSTLEMGIDVGNVRIVGQIGAPWSVNSLAQRLGRSGRGAGEASVLQVFIEQDEPDQNAGLVDRLFLDLLQTTAMVELHLEKWCEPLEADRMHLSTFIQQVLSVITERGGATASELFECLVQKGGFPEICRPMLPSILRAVGAADLIEQTPDGTLITGLRGERIVRHHDFYVAFMVREEFQVSHAGHAIGSVPFSSEYEPGRYLILAGRRWRILDVDPERKSILVEPSPGGRVPKYPPDNGSDLHPRIRQKMKQLLFRDDLPRYLDNNARRMLTSARHTAREALLHERSFLQDGRDTYWFTWTGSRIHRTLYGLAESFGGLKVDDEGVALLFRKATVSDVQETYRRFLTSCFTPEDLAKSFTRMPTEKYEVYLPSDLRVHVYGRERLDLQGALGLTRAALS